MSDSILAAIIAATATLSASLLQLRFSIARELAARSQSGSSRKKSRAPFIVLFVMVGASAVGGFALSQWLTENERAAHGTIEHELRERVEEARRSESQLEITRASERAEVEKGLLNKLGVDGIAVMTMVGPCRPALVVSAPGTTSTPGVTAETATPPPTPSCTETEATTVTLCATIPTNATISEIQLFARPTDSETPWSDSQIRMAAGRESGQARFAAEYTESPDERPGTRQVCQAFTHWATDRGRVARMLVRYTLKD